MAAPPLLGRDAELNRCVDLLRDPEAPPFLLLLGEAGIGKSKLAEAVLGRLDVRALGRGVCYESDRALPLSPLVDALEELLPALEPGSLRMPEQWLAPVGRLLPPLRHLASWGSTRMSDAVPRQQTVLEGIVRILGALPAPALILLEDVHWADRETLEALAYIAHHPAARRARILATARSEDLPEGSRHLLSQLELERRVTTVRLAPLQSAAVHALVAAVSGRQQPDLGARIYAESGGNPLFAVELSRAVAETEAGAPTVPAPPRVEAVIRGRILRVSTVARKLLQAASLFPSGSPFELICQVAELPEEDALETLDELLQRRLLAEQPGARHLIVFSHDLVCRTIYADLHTMRRVMLHRRAFRALREFTLVSAGPGTGSLHTHLPRSERYGAELLARHAVAGELWQEGLHFSLQAAEAARGLSLLEAAALFLGDAKACLQRLPTTAETLEQSFWIHLELANCSLYFQADRMPDYLAAAAADAVALGDEHRLARVTAADGTTKLIAGQIQECRALLEQILPRAKAAGDDALLATCERSLGLALATQGYFDTALEHLQEAALADERVANMEVVVSRGAMAMIHAIRGDFHLADAEFTALTALDPGGTQVAAQAYLLAFQAFANCLRGDWDAVFAASSQAVGQARSAHHPYQEYLASVARGPALARQGDLTGGIAAQEATVALARQIPTQTLLGFAYAGLATLYAEAGRLRDASRAARTGLALATAQGAALDLAMCLKALGLVAAKAGRHQAAGLLLRRAIARFGAMGCRPEAARCQILLEHLVT